MTNQERVDRYAKIHALTEAYKKEMKELKEKLLPTLRKDECPNHGPYLLEVIEAEKSNLSWKDYSFSLARQLFGGAFKKEIAKAKHKAGSETEERIIVKVNPKYKRG